MSVIWVLDCCCFFKLNFDGFREVFGKKEKGWVGMGEIGGGESEGGRREFGWFFFLLMGFWVG